MIRTGVFVAGVIGIASAASAQQFFQASDGTLDFEKLPFADPNDPANWDMITADVAITRGDIEGIYNPIQEPFYDDGTSPLGTLWYFGGTVQDVIDGVIGIGDFEDWVAAAGFAPPSTVGVDGVVYLQAQDAFYDIRFTGWGIGGGGGGSFAYTRAIPAPGALALLGLGGAFVARRRRA